MKKKYFEYAKNIAQCSDLNQKIGCILVYKNKVINTGFNSSKTHPIQKIYNKKRFRKEDVLHTIHAETHAITPLLHNKSINWNKVTLYTYRIKKDNIYNTSRPCESCMALIQKIGIKRICYSTENGFAKEYIGRV